MEFLFISFTKRPPLLIIIIVSGVRVSAILHISELLILFCMLIVRMSSELNVSVIEEEVLLYLKHHTTPIIIIFLFIYKFFCLLLYLLCSSVFQNSTSSIIIDISVWNITYYSILSTILL